MIVGISSFTYGWSIGMESYSPSKPLTEIDLVSKAIAFGVSCLQIGDNLPLHTFSDERLLRLRESALKNSIRLEVGARELTLKNLTNYLTIAQFLKAPLLRFIIDGNDREPHAQNVIQLIKDFLPELKKANVILGIENHDRFKAKELATMMEAVGSEYVGICLDCVNSMGAGEGLEYVADMLSPYTVNLHIKDFSVQRLSHKMGFIITGVPAGTGMTNVPLLMEKLSKYNRCQSAVLEQWVPLQNTLEETIETEKKWAEQSIQYLKSLPYFKRPVVFKS
jgi:3-oxoisoapionate decarboxylase